MSEEIKYLVLSRHRTRGLINKFPMNMVKAKERNREREREREREITPRLLNVPLS